MSNGFNLGDTVKLKSGGPLMTIDLFMNKTIVQAVWFTDDGVR